MGACIFLGTRFKWCHYVGMALVMVSVMVTIAPKLLVNDCSEPVGENCFAAYFSPLGKGSYIKLTFGTMVFWYGIFFISTLPAAVGNVYKQSVLQGADVDVFYATWWSGCFQVLWGFLCLPLAWIPLPGQPTVTPGDFFGSEIGNTLTCMSGVSAQPGDETCEIQPPPYFWIILYLIFNITFNMAMLWLVKRVSAVWAQIATVVCLGLVNVFSSFSFIMGDSANPLAPTDWVGVVIVCMALGVYNYLPEIKKGLEVHEQIAGSFVSDGHAVLAEKIAGASPDAGMGKKGS